MTLITALQSTIQTAETIEDIQEIRANVSGIQAYLKTIKASFEQQNAAAEIKIRAERKAGELLTAMNLTPGIGNTVLPKGISKQQSSRWQQQAATPQAIFDNYISIRIEQGRELTSHESINLGATCKGKDKAFLMYVESWRLVNHKTIKRAHDLYERQGETWQDLVMSGGYVWDATTEKQIHVTAEPETVIEAIDGIAAERRKIIFQSVLADAQNGGPMELYDKIAQLCAASLCSNQAMEFQRSFQVFYPDMKEYEKDYIKGRIADTVERTLSEVWG